MSWEIFLGIVALVSFVGTIGLWISKLAKTLAVLETTISTLKEVIKEFKESSSAVHQELQDKVNDHEKRIIILETHQKEESE